MSAHSECTHPATPASRRTCRDLRHMAAHAEKLGLLAKDTSDKYAAQMTFVDPADRWFDTRVTWLRCWDSNSYQFQVMFSTGDTKVERGKSNLECWLFAVAPRGTA